MPDWIAVALLGLIEGVTEFLPVSSTGHLLLAEQWLPKQTDLFNVVIQTGAVLAVLLVYWRRVWQVLSTWREPASRDFLLKLGVAFLITAAGGFTVKRVLDRELPDTATPVALATLIGGVLILIVERWLRDKPLRADITWTVAVAAGLAQLLAGVFPGTSRSGATILVALAFGLRRPAAAEFSFLLGIPTLLAAGAYETYSALRHSDDAASIGWSMVLWGTFVSAVSAFAVVKWLLRYVQTHTFVIFGWYRIVLGALILLLPYLLRRG